MYNNPDFHMHSAFSDGSDSASVLLENVKNAGIDIFSLTDHDTYAGCEKVSELLGANDPTFINGIEMTCADEFGKYHVLGYAFNTNKDSIKDAIKITQKARRDKAVNRFIYLEQLGYEFTDEEKDSICSLANPGRPHFVNLLIQKGYITDRQFGFEMLKKYHGNERRLSPSEAIDAILYADGIPVLAHGILADGSKNLSVEQISERVERLKKCGLMGLECYYSTYTIEQQEIMISLADKYNMLITAGSDYHGSQKTVRLGQTNNPDPKRMQRFYRMVEMLSE